MMPAQVNAVGIDTAAFQSADSYIQPSNGIADPGAAGSFEMILDAFCGGAELCVPVPKDIVSKQPVLFGLWDERDDTSSVRLTTTGIAQLATMLTPGFLRFVNGSSPVLAEWVAFQFTPRIVEQYLSRKSWELDDAQEAREFASSAMQTESGAKLQTALDKLREMKKFVTPPEYQSLVGWKFDSDNHLAISYLASTYIRGWSYGWSLADHTKSPEYRSLWLRAPALRDLAISGKRSVEPMDSTFPWGRMMRRMFDRNEGALPPDFSVVTRLAMGLRQNHSEILDSARAHTLDGAIRAVFGVRDDGPTPAEEVIVKELLRVGGSLPYAGAGLQDKLVSILRFAANVFGEKTGKAVERITTDINGTWIYRKLRNVEAHLRLEFRRSTFWDVYKDLGVAELAEDAADSYDRSST